MANKYWSVPDSLTKPINSYYSTSTSGVTLPSQGFYPSEFGSLGINQRDSKRNTYYGMVVTNPPNFPKKLVFGFSYLDTKDNQTDEDIYVYDKIMKQIEYFPKGTYESENELYIGTHKGIKDYLLPKTF
jgi:hypothetical protein